MEPVRGCIMKEIKIFVGLILNWFIYFLVQVNYSFLKIISWHFALLNIGTRFKVETSVGNKSLGVLAAKSPMESAYIMSDPTLAWVRIGLGFSVILQISDLVADIALPIYVLLFFTCTIAPKWAEENSPLFSYSIDIPPKTIPMGRLWIFFLLF